MRLMDSGFDLNPVLALLDSLSPGGKASLSPTLKQWKSASGRRRLGDFTPIFQYLSSETDNSPSSAQKTTSHSTALRPPSLPDDSSARTLSIVYFPPTSHQGRKPKKDIQLHTLPLQLPPQEREKNVKIDGQMFSLEERPVIRSKLSPHFQKASIIQKLMIMFPRNAFPFGLSPMNNPLFTPNIHIFIDNSNILIGFMDLIKQKHGFSKYARVQRPAFSFHNLSLILERGRSWQRRVLVGSRPITPVVQEAEDLGYECSLLEKIDREPTTPKRKKSATSSGSSSSDSSQKKTPTKKGEQAVDEVLNMKILESLLDFPPSTLVLASGDGAVGEFSQGFFKSVERALNRGWTVELVSFSPNTNKSYIDSRFRQRWGNKFVIISLDYFVEELLG